MSYSSTLETNIKAMCGIPLEQKYSPDQERDENGRFAGGGGSNLMSDFHSGRISSEGLLAAIEKEIAARDAKNKAFRKLASDRVERRKQKEKEAMEEAARLFSQYMSGRK